MNKLEFLVKKELGYVESKSTCSAKRVGCVIFSPSKNSIYASGFNKSVSDTQCNEIFCKKVGQWFHKKDGIWVEDKTNSLHKKWSLSNEVHAEIMALTNLGLYNDIDDLSCLVTWSPCLDCCKSLINAGIKNIYYYKEFDNIEDIKLLCDNCKVSLIKVGE